ncbi:MAG: hypothetical protein LBC09_03615 [Helicobacteraceae bacterium]|jgi:hypothetical protein|nr:hypothetical protein [Helicobacteraceae bacterium]
MANNRPRNINITKATLFTLFIALMVFALIYFIYIPDMRRFKLAKMTNDRAGITLQQTKSELRVHQDNLVAAKTEHSDKLAVLKNDFSSENFHKDISSFFSKLDLESLKINQSASLKLPRMTISEYNVSAELREPADFYDFVEFINSYKNAIEIALPINVKVDQGDRLLWSFGVKIYQSNPDQY